MLSLNCCRLFKIYTSYISNCRLVKVINIPWFLVPHFYLLLLQSYKRLKLRAFKERLFRKTNGWQIRVVRINTFANVLMFILRELKDILAYFIPFRIIFLQCAHLMEKMRNLFLRSQCSNKMFSAKSKKEDAIHMGIIYMPFLLRNLLKNIYAMSSFMWCICAMSSFMWRIYAMSSFMWRNELFIILKWWLYLLLYFFI